MQTTWKLTNTSTDAWERILSSCKRATRSIDLEQYLLGAEGLIVDTVFDALKDAVQRGVRVRMLLDAIGSLALYRSPIPDALRKEGIELVFQRTFFTPSFRRYFPFAPRDHRKLVVIDGREAHIGGVVICEEARGWRDTNVIIEGPVVSACQQAFDLAWTHAQRMSPLGRVAPDDAEYTLAGNSFHLGDKHLYRAMLRAITAAKKHIYITTPYFSLTHDMRRALLYARRRGVDVTFLFPERSDVWIADIIRRLYYAWLRHNGMRIAHYTKSVLHAKIVTVDGNWATVGSCNLDWLSLRLNYELNLISRNKAFVEAVEQQFKNDIS